MGFGFGRGDMPEAPPPNVAGLGMAPGYTVKRFDTVQALNDYAKANNVSASDAWNPHQIESAVVPSKQEVLLMKEGYFDPAKQAAVDAHEYAHTWGLVHSDDGKGWIGSPDVMGRINMASALQKMTKADAPPPNALASPQPAQTATNALTDAAIPTRGQ